MQKSASFTIEKLKKSLPIIVIIALAFSLRILNIGYSDYQGDETQTFYIDPNQYLSEFLFSQKKGPIQFLVTYSLKSISSDYTSTFITRLPFGLAGFAACLVFYLFVSKLINKTVSFYAALFFVTNGLFTALSRIVQYQPLVFFLTLTSLYFCIIFAKTGKFKHIYLSSFFWCIGLLTHSDAMFIFPMAFALIIGWCIREKKSLGYIIRKFVPIGILMTLVLLNFYIPLIQNSSEETWNYWTGRFTGEITTGIISSPHLFSVYQPVYGLHIYLVLGFSSLLLLFTTFVLKLPVLAKLKKPASIRILDNKLIDQYKTAGLLSWFLFAFIFNELLVKFPGTHIWTYIMPLTIIMGIGVYHLYLLFSKIGKTDVLIHTFVFTVIFAFLFLQSFFIFINHKQQYPWSSQRFILWDLNPPSSKYQLSIFGFPYNRKWKDIGSYIKNDSRSKYFSTNEKKSIAIFYTGLEKSSEKAGYFIQISRPQTFTNTITNERGAHWIMGHKPDKVFTDNGIVVARVYLVPETWDIGE